MEDVKIFTIGEFAERIGVSKSTLRRWERQSILKPAMVLPSGQRRYIEEQAKEYEQKCKARVDAK